MRLEKIEISRLRGIPAGWPTVPIGEKGLIVYGPNGVGKSSIIDALEAVIANRSSLFQENRAGVNWEAASQHILGGPASATVHGKLSAKPAQLMLGVAPAEELKPWVTAGRAASFVLRRYMLLDFINAQPKDRYGLIERFLNLKEFLFLETGLKQLCDSLETTSVSGSTQISILQQRVRQVFGLSAIDPIDGKTLTAALQAKLVEAGMPATDADVADLTKLGNALDAELGGDEVSNRLAALGAAKANLRELTDVVLLMPLYTEVLLAADELTKALAASANKVPVELLEAAQTHVASHLADSCPICEQPVDPAALLKQLEKRIVGDEAVSLAAKTLDGRLKSLSKEALAALQKYKAVAVGWINLGIGDLPAVYGAAQKLLEDLTKLTKQTAASTAGAIKAAFPAAQCKFTDELACVEEAIVAAGGGERRTRLVDAKGYASSLEKDVPNLALLIAKQKTLAMRMAAATQIHDHAVDARKEAVQAIADRVANLANSYYEDVHPGEGIAKSKLAVRAGASASMNLTTSFYGKDSNPLLYYSESHLDTLGLCYFLAIRKLEVVDNPVFKLLLIDDVLHSVDADHRVRLARLLQTHFGEMQLVLVTHDRIFYDRLREILGSGYKYLAITAWSLKTGPALSDALTDLDVVTDPSARIGKSHTDIAAASGRFMEHILKKIAEGLQIPLQARFSREHDLGSLWPPVAKALKKHKGFLTKHPTLAAELDDNDWVRNKIGAHDNDAESPVAPKEVTAFADKLAALHQATSCGSCGSIIKKSGADSWRCDCSKLQYDA